MLKVLPDAHMDQDQARILFERGGFLVLFDVPVGTEFGIDYNSWDVGPKFKGIKMIPPGFHFVFFSSVNSNGQHSPRSGMFLFVQEKDLIVRMWSEKDEELSDAEMSEDDLKKLRGSLKELDSFLGPYPYKETYQKWKSLTNFVSEDTLHRVQPICKKISPLTEVDCTSELSRTEKRQLAEATGYATNPELFIRFTPVPLKKYPDGASPSDITKYSMDQSYALKCMLEATGSQNNVSELLGELQFAFVSFIVGHVFDAFEHWKGLLHLLCSCDEALRTRPNLFIKLTDVLQVQLQEIPKDFFVDIVAQENFLVDTLKIFFSNFTDPCDYDPTLVDKVKKLRSSVRRRFKWDFETENDEDAPVVVDLT